MNTPISPASLDRHAEAIAQVTEMRQTILDQKERIAALKQELQMERDRVHLLLEERARYRSDALACRTFAVKLATIQESIGELTKGAVTVLDSMAQMDLEATPADEVNRAASTVEANLKKLHDIGRNTNDPALATLQVGSSTGPTERQMG